MTDLNTTTEILAAIKSLEAAALRGYESRLFDPIDDGEDDNFRETIYELNRMITETP